MEHPLWSTSQAPSLTEKVRMARSRPQAGKKMKLPQGRLDLSQKPGVCLTHKKGKDKEDSSSLKSSGNTSQLQSNSKKVNSRKAFFLGLLSGLLDSLPFLRFFPGELLSVSTSWGDCLPKSFSELILSEEIKGNDVVTMMLLLFPKRKGCFWTFLYVSFSFSCILICFFPCLHEA